MIGKNLSLICFGYPHKTAPFISIFVKERVQYLKEHFENVDVYALSPIIYPSLLQLGIIEHKWANYANLADYDYDNVHVHYIKRLDLPVEALKASIWGGAAAVIEKRMRQNGREPTILCAHFIWPCGYVGSLLKERLGTPLVITSHGFDAYEVPLRSKRYLRFFKQAIDRADHVIAVSEYLKRAIFDKSNAQAAKVTVIPNGLDTSRFKRLDKWKSRDKLGIPRDKSVILTIGSLTPVKGHRYIIETAASHFKEKKNLLFIFIGSGPDEAELRNIIAAHGLENMFRLVGEKSREEIPSWLNACDLYLQPSVNEGFGIAIIEAMACGKPVIGTDTGSIPELISDNELGTLVPLADTSKLADAILEGLGRVWDHDAISRKGRYYSWEKTAENIMAVYEKIIHPKH